VQQILVRALVARQQGARRVVLAGAVHVDVDQVDQGVVRVDDPGVSLLSLRTCASSQ
jgi:hypothetical protein